MALGLAFFALAGYLDQPPAWERHGFGWINHPKRMGTFGFHRRPVSKPRDMATPLRLFAPVGFSNQGGAPLQFDFGLGSVRRLERSDFLQPDQTPGPKRPTLPTPVDRGRMPNPGDLRFGLWFCILACGQSFCIGLGPGMGAAGPLGQGRAVGRFPMGRPGLHRSNSGGGSFPRGCTGRCSDWFILCVGSPFVPSGSLKTHLTLPKIQRP